MVLNTDLTDSFYKNIVLYMTQFWVCSHYVLYLLVRLMALPVLLLQQLLRPDRLRVLDTLVIQRRLHGAPAICNWCVRPVRVCQDPGPVSAAVYAWPTERILYEDGVLDVGC